MSRKHLFVTDANGRTTKLPADQKNLDRQIREHQGSGRSATVLDDDERIRYGLIAQLIARHHNHQG